jgi:protoporphyrin/coproporphyrin ferrochelatase
MDAMRPYDALVLVSFGGPERPEDVLPFLRNVTRGRGVPDERLAEVATHYLDRGGRSPINDQNRALLGAVRADFDRHGLADVALYWGNRNWDPLLTDTVATMARDGVRRALGFVTSAFSSYSGCRQYQDDLAAARRSVGGTAPPIDKIRPYFDHPGFVRPVVELTAAALADRPDAHLVFTAHSIPAAAAATCDYEAQLREIAALVGAELERPWSLAFQSRSGPPQVPWLEPDVNDELAAQSRAGTPAVLIVPLGFVSDHMEVVHDLDTEARATADRLGLTMTRVPTVGTHPRFVTMVRELFEERSRLVQGGAVSRPSLAAAGARPDPCVIGCCPPPARPVSVSGRPATPPPRRSPQ